MSWVSIIMGILLMLGFNIKHNDDGKETEKGLFLFASVYMICATSLILVPILLQFS